MEIGPHLRNLGSWHPKTANTSQHFLRPRNKAQKRAGKQFAVDEEKIKL